MYLKLQRRETEIKNWRSWSFEQQQGSHYTSLQLSYWSFGCKNGKTGLGFGVVQNLAAHVLLGKTFIDCRMAIFSTKRGKLCSCTHSQSQYCRRETFQIETQTNTLGWGGRQHKCDLSGENNCDSGRDRDTPWRWQLVEVAWGRLAESALIKRQTEYFQLVKYMMCACIALFRLSSQTFWRNPS